MTLNIKTKHKQHKPNAYLEGLRAVETLDGKLELRNKSNMRVMIHSSGPYAEFHDRTESFALWITQSQFQACEAVLESAKRSL